MNPEISGTEVVPSQRLWRLPSWLLNNVAGRANRLVNRFGRPGIRIRYAVLAGLAGTDALHTLDDQVNAVQGALLEPLSPDERAQLNELLQRLLAYHDGYRCRSDDVERSGGEKPSGAL